ncbi:MAG TPA: heme o synthase [Candidatus Acidoferrum sp.]|nr:heme o synthase [Candidatus Acidoferrum sp.]
MGAARTIPAAPASARTSRAMLYLALTKPDVSFLVVMTTLAGFYLGSRGTVDWLKMAQTVLGTTLVAAGTSALNHYVERVSDAFMRRTATRPLPSGQLRPLEAALFGATLVVAGTAYLAFTAGVLAGLLGLFTCATYLGIYTPLKKRTTLATAIGAIPGAMPPLIGWVAAGGSLNGAAWILFAIMCLWQFPHFFAIAWMYREDYSRAGIKMLPTVDPTGRATFRQIIGAALILLPVSALPVFMGFAGVRYFFGAVVLNLLLIQLCLWASANRTNVRAKWLMHATVLHLPILLGLMMYDKLPR